MKLILVRHGESEANVDKEIYRNKFDHDIELTKKGIEQALKCGKKLSQVSDETARIFMSPYTRAIQTTAYIKKNFNTKRRVIMEPRLREQEYKMFKDGTDAKNNIDYQTKKGIFWYRFKHGESGVDVHARVASFIGELEIKNKLLKEKSDMVIVAHNVVVQCFLMTIFNLTVDEFHELPHLDNAEPVILDVVDYFNYKISKKNKGNKELYNLLYKKLKS